MNKLSEPMKRVLRNLATGRRTDYGISGMSQHGGLEGTLLGLRRRGLVDVEDNLTEEGRRIADTLKHAGVIGQPR